MSNKNNDTTPDLVALRNRLQALQRRREIKSQSRREHHSYHQVLLRSLTHNSPKAEEILDMVNILAEELKLIDVEIDKIEEEIKNILNS